MPEHRKFSEQGTILVAASNSLDKSGARYICDGVADDVEIQAALNALPATGGCVLLLDGTYTLTAQIARAIDDVEIRGCGHATLLNWNNTNPVITAGVRDGWLLSHFSTDAGGVSIATATQSAIRSVWIAGVRTDDPGGGYVNSSRYDAVVHLTNGTHTTIQAAITALGVGGGVIFVTPGVWAENIVLPANVDGLTIIGGSWKTIIRGTTGNPTVTIPATAQNVTFRDIRFENTGVAGTDYLVSIGSGDPLNIQFLYCWFQQGKSSIIIANHILRLNIDGCVFYSPATQGVWCSSTFSYSRISNSYFYNAPGALRVGDGEGTIVAANYFESCTNALYVRGLGHSITGNVFAYCGTSSIIVYLTRSAITGNSLWDGAGIIMYASSEVSITGNTIRLGNGIPIQTAGTVSLITIAGNFIHGAEAGGLDAIVLGNSSHDIIIVGNIIDGFGRYGVTTVAATTYRVLIHGNMFSHIGTAAIFNGGGIGIEAWRRNADVFMDVLAASANHVVIAQGLTAAPPIACAIAAQPDVPRNITITITDGDASISAFQIDIVGVNAKGQAATEQFLFAGGLVQTGSVAWATITSVTVTSRTGANAGDVLDVGIGIKLGLSNELYLTTDVYKIKKNAANAIVAVAQVNVTYDTYDMSVITLAVGDDFTIWFNSSLNMIW